MRRGKQGRIDPGARNRNPDYHLTFISIVGGQFKSGVCLSVKSLSSWCVMDDSAKLGLAGRNDFLLVYQNGKTELVCTQVAGGG
jgi:hypothetical protein